MGVSLKCETTKTAKIELYCNLFEKRPTQSACVGRAVLLWRDSIPFFLYRLYNCSVDIRYDAFNNRHTSRP